MGIFASSWGRPAIRLYFYTAIAVLILLLSGWSYRKAAEHFDGFKNIKIMPEISFKYFPKSINGWEGWDQQISETVLRIAANDDYVCRNYRHAENKLHAGLYIAYTCEPMRMLGHRPEVCYPANGWAAEGTKTGHLTTKEGMHINFLVHRFHKPGLGDQHLVVLNYYVVNGAVTADHSFFSGLHWRRPRMRSGQPDYVAQVQISSESIEAAYSLAETLTDQILFHLPRTQNESGPPQQVQQAAR